MGKFSTDAEILLKAIGGKDNISALSHCATRLRFVLIDDSKIDNNQIDSITSVKGKFKVAGQFQIIIGNSVNDFYNDFTKISGILAVSNETIRTAGARKGNTLQRFVAILSEIFNPLIPSIIVGGLILGFRNILESVQFSALGGRTIAESSIFWNGVNHFLWLPGEAIFHFLPVGVTWSITKKMRTTEILGIVLGIMLVSPQLLNAYSVNSMEASEILNNWSWDFGLFSISRIGYQAQVIPAMLAGFLLSYLEKFFRKIVPEAIQMIFVPFLSLLPTIIAAHVVLGPLGWQIASGISTIVNMGLTSSFSWFFGLVFGAFYAPLVITGLHHTTLAIDSQLIADFGYTNLWTMICLSNIAQGAAVAGVAFLNKRKNKKDQISVPAMISAWLGVTEPAMFGVNLKLTSPFVAAMIGSGIAGLLTTVMKVRALSIGVGGLPGLLAIKPQDYGKYLICMLVAIIVPFLLTIFSKVRIKNEL